VTASISRFTIGIALVVVLNGCTSVTTVPTSVPSVQIAPSPSIAADSLPSTGPSVAPSLSAETAQPTKTPKPPKSAPPSQPTGPAGTNLVVTKFVADDEQFVVGIHSQARVTIKNVGTVDAGSFDLGVSFTDGVGGGGITPTAVDGLAAGESIQVSIIIAPLVPGNFTYTATADARNVVAETDETDNTATLSRKVVSAINLTFVPGSAAVERNDDGSYTPEVEVENTGSSDLNDHFVVGITWKSTTDSGTFSDLTCCSHNAPILKAGSSVSLTLSSVQFPMAGGYVVTFAIDPNDEIAESDEHDNVDFVPINVP
jgi:hypothetical protein